MMMSLGLLLIAILAFSSLSTRIFNEPIKKALAQQDIQTIKYRNLVVDLGNGVKTNAQPYQYDNLYTRTAGPLP